MRYREKQQDWRLKIWRENILRRDGFVCRRCGKMIPKHLLHAHHIKSQTNHPELKYRLSNGITLCFECHRKERSSKVRFILNKRW